MSVTTWPVRLFGGRDLGVSFDPVAGTIAILGQSVSLTSFSAALQARFNNAVAAVPVQGATPPFGGSNMQAAVGELLDSAPTWRSAVQTALSNYIAQIGPNDPEGFIH